jgi:23S rRNA pseudouridine2605 synthase
MDERLQKIISRAGIASRRHAEQLIESGQVRVNGHVITELGSKADVENDRIEVAGKVIQAPEASQAHEYLMLNKPAQVVATLSDPEGRACLRDFLHGVNARVYPVGRLDYAASGLILLTNDGDFANRVLKLAPKLPQTYQFKVKGRLGGGEISRIEGRLRAHMRSLRPSKAARDSSNPWYEIKLSSASRDTLRRMLFESEHPVEKLRRVAIGAVELGDLPEGAVRAVNGAELSKLKQTLTRLESQPGVGFDKPDARKVSAATQTRQRR